jgi:hypothetical protein
MEEAKGMRARFSFLFRLTQIRRMMFWSTEASISCNDLSMMMTHEHANSASSPTYLQLMGRGRKLGEPGRYSPDTLGPAAFEDPQAGATSPGVALLRTPVWALHITKSSSKLPASSPSWGPIPSTSTPAAPGTPDTGATIGRGKPEVTTARSPTLVVDDAIKGRHRGVIGRTTNR